MRTLLLDIGNTATKAAFDDNIDDVFGFPRDKASAAIADLLNQKDVARCIISRVAYYADDIIYNINKNIDTEIINANSKLNFECRYSTPQTLGADRIAAIAAAIDICPDRPLLVVDAGTAITYDFVTRDHIYIGGNIAPGLHLRFSTLNNYTSRLPLCSISDFVAPIGNDTKSAIAAGIVNGLRSEIDYYQELASTTLGGDFAIILGGGDYNFFALNAKNTIFAYQNLVLRGLSVLGHL